MARVKVRVVLAAPPSEVWQAVEDIGSHVDTGQFLRFTAAELRLESEVNVGFGPTRDAPLVVGKAK